MEQYERALEHFQRAAITQPEDPIIAYRIGLAAFRLADLELAKEQFQRVLASEPQSPQAQYYLAAVDWMRGDRAAAFQALEEALRDHPNRYRVYSETVAHLSALTTSEITVRWRAARRDSAETPSKDQPLDG